MHVIFLEKRHIGSAVYVPHQMRGFLVKTVYFDDWKTNNRLKVIWTHIFQLGKLSATIASHHATKVTLNFKRRLLTNCNLLTGICLHSEGRSSMIMHFEKPFFLRPMWFYHSADDISLKLVFGNVILRTHWKKVWEKCVNSDFMQRSSINFVTFGVRTYMRLIWECFTWNQEKETPFIFL